MASNIGGTATLIGDPPNIMIGSAAKLSFLDFILNTAPIVVVIMVVLILMVKFMFAKNLTKNSEAIHEIMLLDENKAIEDLALLKKSVVMIILVVLGFMLHSKIDIESCVVALTAAAVMLIIGKQDVEKVLTDIE